jgi:hypothetical protein
MRLNRQLGIGSKSASLRLACSGSLLLLVAGCPVDDREFEPSDPSDPVVITGGRAAGGSAALSGGSTNAAGDPGPEAGAGGTAQAPRTCPDLDENGVEDCTETLVENADFSFGIALWKPEPDVIIRSSQEDGSENSPAGSLSVSSVRTFDSEALVEVGASQCIALPGEGEYAFFAQLFLAEEQESGSARLAALFFESEDCTGEASGSFDTDTVADSGEWIVTGGVAQAPELSASVSIRLMTVKPFQQETLEVLFDDVLLAPQSDPP